MHIQRPIASNSKIGEQVKIKKKTLEAFKHALKYI